MDHTQPNEDVQTIEKEANSKEAGAKPVRRFYRFGIYLLIVAIGLALDLGTKSRVFETLGMPGQYRAAEKPELNATWWLFDNIAGFQTSLNTGALFGMGKGLIPVFAVFSMIAIIAIICWLLFFDGLKSRFITIVLAMISAGILGNLYDRLGLHGLKWDYADTTHAVGDHVYAVRDWILVMIGPDRAWPNFNIADSLLVCGGILLMIYSVFSKDETGIH